MCAQLEARTRTNTGAAIADVGGKLILRVPNCSGAMMFVEVDEPTFAPDFGPFSGEPRVDPVPKFLGPDSTKVCRSTAKVGQTWPRMSTNSAQLIFTPAHLGGLASTLR